MRRVSQRAFGIHSSCPLPNIAERESRSLPVTVFSVNPSRLACPSARLKAMREVSGPVTLARNSREEKLPSGTATAPCQSYSDGRTLLTLIRPPSVLRPKSPLWGPRTNSTCSMSRNSMFDVFVLSCGTPSMYVVTPGFAGLEPMPRKRALLILRALRSEKYVLGEYTLASLMFVMPEDVSMSQVSGVTLSG